MLPDDRWLAAYRNPRVVAGVGLRWLPTETDLNPRAWQIPTGHRFIDARDRTQIDELDEVLWFELRNTIDWQSKPVLGRGP